MREVDADGAYLFHLPPLPGYSAATLDTINTSIGIYDTKTGAATTVFDPTTGGVRPDTTVGRSVDLFLAVPLDPGHIGERDGATSGCVEPRLGTPDEHSPPRA